MLPAHRANIPSMKWILALGRMLGKPTLTLAGFSPNNGSCGRLSTCSLKPLATHKTQSFKKFIARGSVMFLRSVRNVRTASSNGGQLTCSWELRSGVQVLHAMRL